MKTMRLAARPRPFRVQPKKIRSRPQAAAELVRIEYERDRLERDLTMIEARRDQVRSQLRKLAHRAQTLTRTLS